MRNIYNTFKNKYKVQSNSYYNKSHFRVGKKIKSSSGILYIIDDNSEIQRGFLTVHPYGLPQELLSIKISDLLC